MPSANLQQRHRLVVDLGADRRQLRGDRARFEDLAAEIMQHVELMDGELGERPARRLVLVPAPGFRRELERALVGEIRLHEGDAAELAGIDRLPDEPDAGHQPRAVADRDADAECFFQRLDGETFLQRAGDRLLGVDVLAGLGHFARERQMLLVGHREDHAADRRIGQQRGEIGRRRDAEFLREGRALVLGAAVGGDDFQLVGLLRGAREHLGPAAEPDDGDFDLNHSSSFTASRPR